MGHPQPTTTIAFLALILTGVAWVAVVGRMAPGEPGILVSVLAGAFACAFIWQVIMRLRSLLARPERRLRELGLLALNLTILIGAFAWVHKEIGLMDISGPAPHPTSDYGDALYFSVVTSTTLGYGDFIPLGPGRPVAAIQALTGYFILGILVSTGFQIIAPHTSPEEAALGRGSDQEAESAEAAEGVRGAEAGGEGRGEPGERRA